MKTIALAISIGAVVGGAMAGLNSVSKTTNSLGKKIDELGAKKIDIIANDKNVLKVNKSLTHVESKLENLKKIKNKLYLQLDKEKVSTINKHLREVKDDINSLEDEEHNIGLKIKATTDEKELKKLNKTLDGTRKKIMALSNKKIGLNKELKKTKEENEKVNEKIERTKGLVDDLNAKRLKIKDELKSAETQAEKTNRKIGKIEKTIASINKSKIKIKAIVANRAEFKSKIMETVALASSVVIPLKTAIDFESSLSNVKKVTSFDDAGLKNFGTKIIDLTNKKIPMAREQLLSISAEMAQLGIKDKHLLDYTKLTAKMSVAWDMEAGDTGEAVGKMKNIFKLNFDGVKRVGDAINHLSNNVSAKAPEIITTMKTIGGSANTFGLSAIKTTALASSFIALGETPETAASGINALLGKLIKIGGASKKVKKTFGKLGLSARYFKNMIKNDAEGALMSFFEKLNKVPKADHLGILTEIFGEDHAPKILKVAGSMDVLAKSFKLVDVNSKAFKIDVLSESLARLSLSPKKSKKAIKDLAATFDNLDLKNDDIWKVFDELKIDDKKFKIKLDKNEDGAIDDFLKSIKGMDETKQLKITTKLFGAEKAQKVMSQLKDVKDYKLKLDVSTKSMTKTIDSLSKLDFKSKKTISAFDKISMSSKRFGMNIEKNTDKAFEQLLKQLKTVDKATQKEILADLVGKDEAKHILNITDGLDGYLKKMEEVNKEKHFANSIEREFAEKAKTTAAKLTMLGNSVSSIGVNLGTLFLPSIVGASDAINSMSSGLGSLIEEFPETSKWIGGIGGGLIMGAVALSAFGFAASFLQMGIVRLGFVMNVFKIKTLLSTKGTKAHTIATGIATLATKGWGMATALASGGFKKLGGAMKWVWRLALANPVGLALGAIAGIAYLIYDNWDWLKGKWNEIMDSIGFDASGAWEGLKTIFSWRPLGVIISAFSPMLTFVKDLWNGMSFADAGGKLIDSFVQGIRDKWDSASKAIRGIADTVGGWFSWDDDEEKKTMSVNNIGMKPIQMATPDINQTPTMKPFKMATAGFMMASSLAVATPDINQTPIQSPLEIDRPFVGAVNNNTTQTIEVNFGATHITNETDNDMFHENISKTVQQALRDAEREKNSKRLYD